MTETEHKNNVDQSDIKIWIIVLVVFLVILGVAIWLGVVNYTIATPVVRGVLSCLTGFGTFCLLVIVIVAIAFGIEDWLEGRNKYYDYDPPGSDGDEF
jgi:type III secretory pathway component EscU